MTTQSKTTYAVSGMTCSHCELSITEEVLTVAGVTSATADRTTGTLVVTGDADPAAITSAVQSAGYEVTS